MSLSKADRASCHGLAGPLRVRQKDLYIEILVLSDTDHAEGFLILCNSVWEHSWHSDPKVPGICVLCIQERVGKEFLDMQQNERRTKFIRVGNTIRTAGQHKGELS